MTLLVAGGLLLGAVAPQGAAAAATPAEYAAQADPICNSANKDLDRIWKRYLRFNKRGPAKGAVNALRKLGARIASSNGELRLIAPPPGDEARIDQWIDIWDQVANRWKLAARAYKLMRWGEVSNHFGHIDRLASEARGVVFDYPFQACA